MPTIPQTPQPDGWNPGNEFDGHRTPEDHSGCTQVSVTLCADDWIIVSHIIGRYAGQHPGTDLGQSAGLIDHYVRKALGF